MRINKVLAAFLCACLFSGAGELAVARWERVGVIPKSATAEGAQLLMASERAGWMLDTKSGLWATSQGGRAWTKLSVPPGCLRGAPLEAHVSQQGNGVIRCNDAVCTTIDWGLSWQCRALPVAGLELSVCCTLSHFDRGTSRMILGGALYEAPKQLRPEEVPGRLGMQDQHGRLRVSSPVVYKTEGQGGWSDPKRIAGQPDRIIHMVGADGNHMLAVTEVEVFLSEDGAKTWLRSEFIDGCLGKGDDPDCDRLVTAVSFDAQTGSAWLALRSGVLYRSTDYGRSWRVFFRTQGPRRVAGSHFEELVFTNAVSGWALTMSGDLRFSADGGSSWSHVPTPGQVQSLSVTDSKTVWILVGESIYRLK